MRRGQIINADLHLSSFARIHEGGETGADREAGIPGAQVMPAALRARQAPASRADTFIFICLGGNRFQTAPASRVIKKRVMKIKLKKKTEPKHTFHMKKTDALQFEMFAHANHIRGVSFCSEGYRETRSRREGMHSIFRTLSVSLIFSCRCPSSTPDIRG